MKKKTISYKDFEICVLYLEEISIEKKEEILKDIISNLVYIEDSGYLGFEKEDFDELEFFLENTLFAESITSKDKIDDSMIESIINSASKSIDTIGQYLRSRKLYVYVFPSNDTFLSEMMDGVGGYPTDQTIVLTINSQNIKDFENAIEKTVLHESVHLITLERHDINSTFDQIIMDGLSEVFCEDIGGHESSQCANSISYDDSKKIFFDIKKQIIDDNMVMSEEIFYGTANYPLWAGYAIGYNIVRSFIKNHPDVTWETMFEMSFVQILNGSDFAKDE
jgi:uncharacterized protein YjaZ